MEADDQWNSAVPLQNLWWYEVRLAGVCLTYRPPIGICTRGQGQTTSRSYPVLGAESPAAELAALCSNRLHSGCCRALLSELNLHSKQSLVQDNSRNYGFWKQIWTVHQRSWTSTMPRQIFVHHRDLPRGPNLDTSNSAGKSANAASSRRVVLHFCLA